MKPHRTHRSSRNACAFAALVAISMPSISQTSVSLNVDYVEGRYGESEKSSTWTMPLIVKHRTGPLGLKLNVPYVRATGVAAAGGDRFSSTNQVQEGIGDIVATASYELFSSDDGRTFDIGSKAKIVAGDKKNDLITTGKNDYSLFVDTFQPIGGAFLYAALGWTQKGDPTGVDYRDPWYATLGLSHRFANNINVGMLYDYRQKVTARGAPVSESTVYIERKLSSNVKLQAYLLYGFSNASPDLGAGATATWTF